jgi:predicted negative regulator of RcsB-dependent stress response
MRAKLTPLYLAGVTKQMARAYEKGPYIAGPAKCLGDVLVTRGRPVEALARYETALKYAPNWKQLKEGREVTAKQKS